MEESLVDDFEPPVIEEIEMAKILVAAVWD
jgi:hypothetical protein